MKMKITAFLLAILLSSLVNTAYAQEDFLNQIENYADVLNDLLEKYEKAEIDLIKTENFTIIDTQGGPRDCDVGIFYNNGKQPRFRTTAGHFEGNFDHGKDIPTKPYSVRLWNCPCRPISVVHSATWYEINEVIEKIRNVIEDEIKDKIQEQAKEIAKEGVKKVFEKLGHAASASGFLSGFGYGASLGQPIGDYLTDSINQILDTARKRNIDVAEANLLDVTPYHVNIGRISPRGGLGNMFGTSPQLINSWRVTVRCGTRDVRAHNAGWHRVREPIRTPQPPREYPPDTSDDERREIEERERQEQRKVDEENRRWEQQQREREREAQRYREEQERRYQEEQRRIRELAREIAQDCPICEPIRQQIEQAGENINQLEQEIPELGREAASAEKALADAEINLQQARERLSNFRNPRSWVDSDGRQVTSTDLEVQRELSRQNWQRYVEGQQSSQETMDNWENQNEPQIHEEAKQRAEERLEEIQTNAEEAVEQARNNLNRATEALERAERELQQLRELRDRLNELLDECLKKCREMAEDIARGDIRTYDELLDIEPLTLLEDEELEPEITPVVETADLPVLLPNDALSCIASHELENQRKFPFHLRDPSTAPVNEFMKQHSFQLENLSSIDALGSMECLIGKFPEPEDPDLNRAWTELRHSLDSYGNDPEFWASRVNESTHSFLMGVRYEYDSNDEFQDETTRDSNLPPPIPVSDLISCFIPEVESEETISFNEYLIDPIYGMTKISPIYFIEALDCANESATMPEDPETTPDPEATSDEPASFMDRHLPNINFSNLPGEIGITTGINFANMNNSDLDSSTRMGIAFGFYYRQMLADGPLYFQPEFLYNQKGHKFGEFTTSLNYLSLNLLFAYYFAQRNAIRPFVKAGPYVAVNVRARDTYGGEKVDISDYVNTTDFGARARVGVQTSRIEAGAFAEQGFRSIFESEDNDARNFVIGVFVGISLAELFDLF